MNERFDDIVRRRLEGHESNVPEGLFDAISNQPEVQDAFFDNAIRSKLAGAKAALPAGMFDAIHAATSLEHLHFDSAIRGKIEDYTSAVPADMWQRVMAEKDRRRRPVAWWWVAATVLLLAGAGTTFLVKRTAEKPSSIASVKMNQPEQAVADKLKEKPGNENKIDKEVANPQSDQPLLVTEPDRTEGLNSNQKSAKQDAFQPNSNQLVISRQRSGAKNALSKNVAAKQVGITKASATETGDELQPGAALQTIDDDNQTTAQLSIIELLRNAARLAPSQLLKAKPHNPVIPCPTNGDEKRNDWYVDVYGSAFLLQKNIQDKGAGKNAKAGFDTTLHRQVSFNAGINLVKNIGKNFLLKTGVQYNRINESFRLTQVNERRLITTISVRTVIIAPGDTVRIRDTSTVEQIGTAQHRHQNTYTQWDIPLIIGYEFGGENIRLNANAGIITNIRSGYQGEMIADSTKQIIDINNYNGQPLYRKTVGFSLYAGLSILKPLSEKMSLLIEPHARIGLGNTTNGPAWFSQKNSTMGLSIGLRYKFGGSRQRIY